MAKSLLDRLSARDYALIKDSVYYDPTAPAGLRWSHEAKARSGRGHSAGDPVGKTFFVGGKSYSASNIVLILHDIWPKDYQNVVNRKDPGQGWSDVANLQWTVRGDSQRISAELKRVALVVSVLGCDEPDLGDRYRLNAICKRMHKWNGHNLSLQRRAGNGWRCDQCERERESKKNRSDEKRQRAKEKYLANLEENRMAARERMRAKREAMPPEKLDEYRDYNRRYQKRRHQSVGRKSRSKALCDFIIPPHLVGHGITAADIMGFVAAGVDLVEISAEALRQNNDMWFNIKNIKCAPSVAKLVFDEQKRYWEENPEAKKAHDRWWAKEKWRLTYQFNSELRFYHREKSKRRKARLREVTSVQVKPRQIRERFRLFDNCCAYCGSGGDMQIEHVVPIAQGGTHALGNIVPSCQRCNMSKRDHNPETWYRQQPFFSELRWKEICKVLEWSKSSVGQLALL